MKAVVGVGDVQVMVDQEPSTTTSWLSRRPATRT
jgi:hypothetical protein